MRYIMTRPLLDLRLTRSPLIHLHSINSDLQKAVLQLRSQIGGIHFHRQVKLATKVAGLALADQKRWSQSIFFVVLVSGLGRSVCIFLSIGILTLDGWGQAGSGKVSTDHNVVLGSPFNFDVALVFQTWEFHVDGVAGVVIPNVDIWIESFLVESQVVLEGPM